MTKNKQQRHFVGYVYSFPLHVETDDRENAVRVSDYLESLRRDSLELTELRTKLEEYHESNGDKSKRVAELESEVARYWGIIGTTLVIVVVMLITEIFF